MPTAYLLKQDDEWTWSDLRDYVMHELEERHGPQTVNAVTQASTFKGFMKRHETRSAEIARYAMETCRGRWYGNPITVNSFCKNSDPTFANEILDLLDR